VAGRGKEKGNPPATVGEKKDEIDLLCRPDRKTAAFLRIREKHNGLHAGYETGFDETNRLKKKGGTGPEGGGSTNKRETQRMPRLRGKDEMGNQTGELELEKEKFKEKAIVAEKKIKCRT